MKPMLQTALVIFLVSFNSFASAADAATTLSLAMELKEGETVVGTPRIFVIAGERASIRVGSKVSSAGADNNAQHGWQVDVVPTLTALGEVLTSVNVKFSASTPGGITQTRSVSVETKQQLGEAVMIQIPGGSGDPPLSLKVRADVNPQ